ncbi:hypothetical protein [Maricaulis maris]|uniref:hypothetical protein n=1 Tax=Maricaulis maris TaxID=74318 RepID=UPI0011C41156|nr:hypothetical protein [Maricaulis maris]
MDVLIGTLAVGAFGWFVCLMAARIYGVRLSALIDRIPQVAGSRIAAALLASYAVGLGFENLSNYVFSHDKLMVTVNLDTDASLRAKALFGREVVPFSSASVVTHGWDDMARSYVRLDLTEALGDEQAVCLRRLLEAVVICGAESGVSNMDQVLERIASNLYYHAKNIVFLSEGYREELVNLQHRSDLARSIAFLSAILFVGVALHFVAYMASMMVAKSVTMAGWLPLALLLALLALVAFSGYLTYTQEEWEINRRVFGYFRSLRLIGEYPSAH